MPNAAPKIELRWRDENYGAVHAVAAFRNYGEPATGANGPTRKFRGCLKPAGFAFHHRRCSFIASKGEGATRKRALCDEPARAGFTITMGDVRPKDEQP